MLSPGDSGEPMWLPPHPGGNPFQLHILKRIFPSEELVTQEGKREEGQGAKRLMKWKTAWARSQGTSPQLGHCLVGWCGGRGSTWIHVTDHGWCRPGHLADRDEC